MNCETLTINCPQTTDVGTLLEHNNDWLIGNPYFNLMHHSLCFSFSQKKKIQVKAGHSGLCCQKLSEAEAMVDGGLEDIFITNQVFLWIMNEWIWFFTSYS